MKLGSKIGSVISFHPATISGITALLSPETVFKERLFLKKRRNQVYITSTQKKTTKSKKKKRNIKSFINKDGFDKADTK